MMGRRERFDVLVVGGGHAGIEASLAAARQGASCALVTHDIHEIGRMPCNPAIGGLGKGHLVKEIDILGGEMGRAIDATGIQFRMLNLRKGPAVHSPRAQADKYAYQQYMENAVLDCGGLTVIEAEASGIRTGKDGRVTGVMLASGDEVRAARVVLCSGTFLRGLMHVGDDRTIGGREGAASSEGISGSLRALGLELRRLKTGTPPRLHRDTINFDQLTPQPGDEHPVPFSFRTEALEREQILCHQVYTHAGTHDLIRGALDRSPLYAGVIEGGGPRYCPSIEDKVVRFADRDRHLLFLEPEGLQTHEIYVNGLSTSLPADVQVQVVRSLPGLERAELVRFGYAVEYDSVPSWQVAQDLQVRKCPGLYLAGQILGTSGYEEAAAQGLLAGVNAVRNIEGKEPFVPSRAEAYLGVLVDDLVTKEISEPYRMFTSRAEHRLALRCDNAAWRLENAALELGLLAGGDTDRLRARNGSVRELRGLLARGRARIPGREGRLPVEMALLMPDMGLRDLGPLEEESGAPLQEISSIYNKLLNQLGGVAADGVVAQVENDIKYRGYISKNDKLLKHRAHLDHLELPERMDYQSITAWSFEARENLSIIRPSTLGQAARIDGVRAGDLAVLTVMMRKWSEGAGNV